MFCGMVTIGGARGLHDRRSGRSVVGSRLLEKDVLEKPQLHSDSFPKALPQEMEDGVNTYP